MLLLLLLPNADGVIRECLDFKLLDDVDNDGPKEPSEGLLGGCWAVNKLPGLTEPLPLLVRIIDVWQELLLLALLLLMPLLLLVLLPMLLCCCCCCSVLRSVEVVALFLLSRCFSLLRCACFRLSSCSHSGLRLLASCDDESILGRGGCSCRL